MSSLDATSERLARKILAKLQTVLDNERLVIGIAGVPGSGKTTLGAAVSALINKLNASVNPVQSEPIAVAIPMDGFHFSRAHLAAMPDSATAVHRRGAAFTFDAYSFYDLIKRLASPIQPGNVVTAPSFDHAVKDPLADSLVIMPANRVVLVEGNYCALNREPWSSAAKLMTELWYVDVPKEVTWDRLAKRHLASGIVKDEKEAIERARETDELNAQDIRQNLLPVNEVIL